MDGDWKTAYYDYRDYMNSKGVALDKGYNPPVHWNELYDNPLWTVVGDSGENRQKYYRREDMAIEIAKAAELGCEAFYMDPGWDDAFGSFRWDESRLGDLADFIDWMGKTYGINKLALHTPIAPWCDPNQFPAEAMCMNEKGERYGVTCVASKQYREELAKRLAVLGNKGAYMYLFDGSWFEHMCYDPNHGHSVPKTRQDHIDGILANIRATKAYTPGVVIEQHDMITGPGTPRYTPMYMFYKVKDGIDELWAHEYMNEPLDDVISRRAAALYYNDMGIDTPIYLHIDLRQDNRNATALWWYYSTCRHMGMGGKSADPVIWNAQKIATKVYKANKAFYTQGAFYGIDETVHVHTLPNLDKAVVNFFNLEEKTQDMTAEFTFADIGLKPGLLNVEGGEAVVDGEKITLTVKDVPGIGNAFVKLHRADPKKAVKVSGKVTLSASGESVPGALVEIGGFGTLSGDDGSYELYIPAGTYTGAASFGEIASDSAAVTAKKGGAGVDFVLKGSVIEGKIVNTLGKAVEKAVVSHDAGIGVLTDEDGAYKLFVPAGRYTLNAAAFGSGVVDKKIRVAENKVVKCDFETEAQLGVWNASKDFHNLADSNSPWQYGYVGDNGLYTLIGVNERHGIDGIGGWGNANTSLMARNMNANAWMDSHSYLEAGQVGMHCNPVKGNTAVMRWTSPVTGKVVVYGRFTPQSFGPTTDSNVKLFFDSRPVAEGRVSGFFGRGVNHFRDAEGGTLEFKFTDIRDIKSEDYYEFLSAPANGRADSQLVALDATIAAVVEIDDMSDAEGLDTNTHVLAEKGEVVSVDGSEAVVATEKGAVRFTKAADLKVGDKGSFVGKVTDGGIEFVFVK
ncbi:MAG: hypothetical protein J6X53_08500, partial [Abditibacteriota bacterium]|nr:hypothetical protein [Abditibacteriota bacterium]